MTGQGQRRASGRQQITVAEDGKKKKNSGRRNGSSKGRVAQLSSSPTIEEGGRGRNKKHEVDKTLATRPGGLSRSPDPTWQTQTPQPVSLPTDTPNKVRDRTL